MIFPKIIYDKILSNLLTYLLCDKFSINFNNYYLIKNYSYYSVEIIDYCLVSKQWFELVSKSISHCLYCHNRLDEWIDRIYKSVKSRFFNIINNDELGSLMVNEITFNNFYKGYKKYQEKIKANPKYNNNDNNNSEKKKIIIDYINKESGFYSSKDRQEIYEIVQSKEEIPDNVQFKIKIDYNSGLPSEADSIISSIPKLFKIVKIQEIDHRYCYYDFGFNEISEVLEMGSLESLVLSQYHEVKLKEFIKVKKFNEHLKKFEITLPFQKILYAHFVNNETNHSSYNPQELQFYNERHNYLLYTVGSYNDLDIFLQDWSLAMDKLQKTSFIDLHFYNSLPSITLNSYFNQLETEYISENTTLVTEPIKTLLLNPNCTIKYFKLSNFSYLDGNICNAISNNISIKSLMVNLENSYNDGKLTDVFFLSITQNQNIKHINFITPSYGTVKILSKYINNINLLSLSIKIQLDEISDVVDLINQDVNNNIKELKLQFYKSPKFESDDKIKSLFKLYFNEYLEFRRKYFRINNKIIIFLN